MKTSRTLKMALAASVALNIFIVAGGVALWLNTRPAPEVPVTDRATRQETVMDLLNARPPEVAGPLKEDLRAVALTARPDFEEARASRREAIAMTASDRFDAAQVQALLEQSRTAETRGRARLETGAVELLAELSPEDRKALSRILARYRPHAKTTKDTAAR